MKENENGYFEGELEHSYLIHRQIAYKEIYLKNRDKFPLRFRQYVIHHKDRDKHNNGVRNLDIVTRKDHEDIHKLGLHDKEALDRYRDRIKKEKKRENKKKPKIKKESLRKANQRIEKRRNELIKESLKEVNRGTKKRKNKLIKVFLISALILILSSSYFFYGDSQSEDKYENSKPEEKYRKLCLGGCKEIGGYFDESIFISGFNENFISGKGYAYDEIYNTLIISF